jgi:D-alanyl-D-alanine carboxypeptidase
MPAPVHAALRASPRQGQVASGSVPATRSEVAAAALVGQAPGVAFDTLGQTAGNRAIVELLGRGRQQRPAPVQRTPAASPDVVDPAADGGLATNLGVAEHDIAQTSWLQGQLDVARAGAGTTRTGEPALAPSVLIETVWRLPPTSSGMPAPLRARYLVLRQRVVAGLTRLQTPLVAGLNAYLATPSVHAALQAIVDGTHADSPSFDVFELAADLWEHWLRLAPSESLGGNSITGGQQRRPLRAVLDGMVEGWADTFSGGTHVGHRRPEAVTPLADPADAEIAAVATAIRPRSAWVGAGDMATVASEVAATLGRPPADIRAVLPRWLIHAERQLIAEAHLSPPTPAVWAYARSVYVSTLDLPIWRYYTENITRFDLFGRQIGDKSMGVHKDVVPTLRLVEQEAQRIAGVSSVAALNFAPGQWGGFRFEPQKASLTDKRHVSFHATGLAIDFRVITNNVIQGQATDLLDLIAAQGGSAATTGSIAHGAPHTTDQEHWADTVQGHLASRDSLRARIAALPQPAPTSASTGTGATTTDAPAASGDRAATTTPDATTPTTAAPDPELARLQSQLAAEDQWLAGVGQQAQAVTLGASGESIRTHLEEVEAGFQRSFRAHFGDRPPVPEQATPAERNAIAAARRQALVAGWPAMQSDIRASLSEAAQPAFDRTFPARTPPIGLLMTLDPFLDHGLTDQPPWMVQAFTSLGWRWGGGWHDPLDAMHFDFMATLPGVRN